MTVVATPEFWALKVAAGVCVGAIVGSFAATAGLRLASGLSPLSGRSRCDGCARQLGWHETVPFAGLVLAGGQCRTCNARIDRFHLLGELLGAAVGAVCLTLVSGPLSYLTTVLCLLMLVTALIDVKTMRLPDVITAGIAVCALGMAYLTGHVVSGLVCSALSLVGLLAVKYGLEHYHAKPMLGLGDIKLIAALALWLGLRTPAMIALAAGFGLVIVVVAKPRHLIPFGPMIAAAAFTIGLLVPEGWLL